MHHAPLHPVQLDRASAHDLRAMIATARARLHEVLEDRARSSTAAASGWSGPHRDRYDEDAADLLSAGHVLDHVLRDLLLAVDAELEATTG